jgi:hypothetical protein
MMIPLSAQKKRRNTIVDLLTESFSFSLFSRNKYNFTVLNLFYCIQWLPFVYAKAG